MKKEAVMRRTVVMAFAIGILLLGSQGQALATDFPKPFEDDVASYTFEENGDKCTTVSKPPFGGLSAKGCFVKYGDIWRIQDGSTDGDQTFIYWENWLHDGSTWRPYRHGECNNNLNAPNWGQCNKDLYENSSTNYYGGRGSRVRFQVCTRDIMGNYCIPEDIGGATWVSNDS
jgi:hypothetical protein